MTMAIPGDGANALALLHAEARERVGELARASMRIAIGVAMDRSFDRAGDDLGVPMAAIRMADERGDHERPLHHQSLHGSLLADVCCTAADALRRHARLSMARRRG